MTLTMMDDPVLILAEREKLIKKLPAEVTALADVIPGAKPRGGMWANWCQPLCSFSYNTKALPNGLSSYAEAWDPKFKERIIVISMRITQAIAPLLAATHHVTKKPLAQCLPEWQAGIERMKELRPNIIQVSSNYPQAQQLNETGECDLFMSPDSRTTLLRKSQGAPVDQGMPKEGLFAMPAGVALVEGGPNQDAGITFLNEMLSPETQAYIAQDLPLAADQHQDRAAGRADLPRPDPARLGVLRGQPQRHDRALRAGGVGAMKAGPARADTADTQAKAERYLEVAGVTKRFGSTVVLQDLSIAVGRSEFVSLLGPSGCGKTTLLRLIAGLLVPERGTISIGGRDLTRVAAHRRNIGVVFQNYALFPHLTVAENVAFGLKAQRVAKAEIRHAGARGARARAHGRFRRSQRACAFGRAAAAHRGRARDRREAVAACCSTSHSARSTASCARRCRSSCATSCANSASPRSSSPTTRTRRS